MKPLDEEKYARRMILIISIGVIISMLGAIIYYRSLNCLPFIFGAIVGGAASVINVLMLKRTVERVLDMEQGTVKNYVRLQQFSRLFTIIAALLITVFIPFFNIWGGVIGVLLFPISTQFLKFMK